MTKQLEREQRRLRDLRDPLIGKYVAGRYQVLCWLGRGAYSNVYRAAQVDARDRLVALKVIRRAQSEYASAQSGSEGNPFVHELEFAQRLKHPAAVRVFDVGRSEQGVDYIAMECVEGDNLGDLVREGGPLPLGWVIRLADDLLGYVDEAARHGFAHCDIKPDNVMMRRATSTSGVRFKILDLGQARWLAGQERQHMAAGTPAFMAPELARGAPVTIASELYAVGTVLYEALTGDHALRVERPTAETYTSYLCDPGLPIPTAPTLDLRDDCPESVAELVEWALERRPADRPRSAAELREALFEVAEAEGIPTDGLDHSISGKLRRAWGRLRGRSG